MEQSELRQWERKCVQEEVPWCIAACPLHVDAKSFCAQVAQQRWDKAWAVLAKTMPLPGVLARLCDGPCKDVCARKDAGGAVEMDRLERFCVEQAKPVPPPRLLPSRHKSVAVVGAGMTGLCAAWEMVRRGFQVALYCVTPGGSLPDLPEGVLQRELDSLKAMGTVIEAGASISPALVESLLAEKDAVFVDSDDMPAEVLSFGEPDAITLGTRESGLFASRTGETSAVLQAATGRRAANSIERFTQGVSMVSNRELEGPYETRLYTNLAKVEPVQPVAVEAGYTEAQARDEARRCLQCECMECVKSCEYLRHYKHYPKIYVRQIYNNENIVMGTRQANGLINSCMLCGQCEVLCPEDFSMADVCLQARRGLVKQGKMPPSAHEFALRDMAFADGEKCALTRHAPGGDVSEYVFFPGCQLTASDPEGVEAAYADLRNRLGSVGLMLRCCSTPAQWAGQEAMAEASMTALKGEWESLGKPRIIVACPTCLKTLRQSMPEAELLSHWSVLRALGLPGGASFKGGELAVNDPCAARHDTALQEDVRALLDQLKVTMSEPEMNGEYTQCCGYGGLLSEANPDLGMAAAGRRAQGMDEDTVSYCVMCRDMISRTGKRSLHLYDLLYPRLDDPGARPAPGYSVRRENRVHLRERLLRELWQDDEDSALQPYESIEVLFTEQASNNLEARRILKSDVQKVLYQARQSGTRFVHGGTGHYLASFRPAIVTYWVEYEQQGDAFLVHNAWYHRMRILGGQP
ncbi:MULTISPECIES: pyridine nucleotide-disulfide oxidoreductase/dicluster-binding protein [unclassified Pseudodesulfovibrio]|uniref:pyridine nucleotide-disulfide oxidoreductase/dicluster-binding protein n=1 Tax=unclassified Pseudodesulfovibrio TaxID=2661612 RepID=UPI000FEB724C|nr:MULTISPECIES: pyridine nucleotide-disulfide oxidoreductase/dicluster-binding protein [unclassified Pseudodesulfovibrio]MCJ2164786.1 heterodisulfide reductase-related iron-sulfur binding cluster [Pseudodesulfovibrio sp. S3-i]RWU04031.1 Fe-S oxidoreductase [Pseudodesulfovibrio sp. S3]